VRPNVFDLQLAPAVVFAQRKNLHACVQPSGNIGVDFNGDFAVAPLCFDHERQSDKVSQFKPATDFH
jgi:hypothetical protein